VVILRYRAITEPVVAAFSVSDVDLDAVTLDCVFEFIGDGSETAAVTIEYWPRDGYGRDARTLFDAVRQGDRRSFALDGLYPSVDYEYEITVASASWSRTYSGAFSTAPLASVLKITQLGPDTARIDGFTDEFIASGRCFERLTLPDEIDGFTITEIADGAFSDSRVNSFRWVVLPKRCARIGDRAFAGCPRLASVTLDDCVEQVGDGAFADCPRLVSAAVFGPTEFGTAPFRNSGFDVASGLILHVAPERLSDAGYLANLRDGCMDVLQVEAAGFSVPSDGSGPVTLSLEVRARRDAGWGEVDTSAMRVRHASAFGGAVTELAPEVTGVDARGFIHLRVEAPEGEAGLFRVILP